MTWRLFLLTVILALSVAVLCASLAWAGECRGSMVRASWYGSESGNRTATGQAFDGSQLLAAHKTLRFGTKVRFTYKGKSVTVPILDRGPYISGRTYDLSRAAAERIGMIRAGVVTLCAEVVE